MKLMRKSPLGEVSGILEVDNDIFIQTGDNYAPVGK